jgi:predicted nucleic acid-binding protein
VTRVVADASACAALVFQEPGFERIVERFDGATVCAPELLKFELANVAVSKASRDPIHAPEIFARLSEAFDRRWGIVWHNVDATDVAVLALATGLSAYDATYLWLAGWLEADLVTLDRQLASVIGLEVEETPS